VLPPREFLSDASCDISAFENVDRRRTLDDDLQFGLQRPVVAGSPHFQPLHRSVI
jgi:hypothetical protein